MPAALEGRKRGCESWRVIQLSWYIYAQRFVLWRKSVHSLRLGLMKMEETICWLMSSIIKKALWPCFSTISQFPATRRRLNSLLFPFWNVQFFRDSRQNKKKIQEFRCILWLLDPAIGQTGKFLSAASIPNDAREFHFLSLSFLSVYGLLASLFR